MRGSQTPTDRRTDRALALAAGTGSAVTLCFLFWPAALRRVFLYGDLGNHLLPMRLFFAQSLERGITPLWLPNLFCGFYVHGDGQIGIFHPLRWLLYRTLPVSEAFNLECLVSYPVALVGVALFLRRLDLPLGAALFGGLSFAFSPYMTVRLTHVNAIAVIAHLGWLLFAIDVVLRGPASRQRYLGWVGVALLTGSQLLVGYPGALVYCWLLAIPYALFVAASRREPWPALAVAGALAAGFLLGGIQIIPTLQHLAASQRAAPSYEYLTELSLHPLNLLSIVAPSLFWDRVYLEDGYNPVEVALYFGAVVPIATLWVLLRWRQLALMRALVAGLLALSAVALLLALGRHTVLYRWVLELPVIGLLRVPSRYSLVLYFAGAIFAAIAFADLQRSDPSPETRRRSWWVWSVPVASWLVAGIAVAQRDLARGQDWFALWLNPTPFIVLGPLAFTLSAALFFAAARGHRAALFGLVLLALADHASYGASLWWSDPPRTLADYRASIARPAAPPPQRVATSIDWVNLRTPDGQGHYWASTPFIVHDARLVSGYAGVVPSRRLDYTKPASLRVAGASAQWVVRDRGHVERLPGALPRARMVARAVRSAEPEVQIEVVDVATTALVDEPVDLEYGPAGEALIQQDEPGAIRVATRARTRQLLVLAESYHRGWRVTVDGQERRVRRVYGDFMGCVVEAGAHEVRFRFAPRSFGIGRWTSLAGIGIVGAVALAGVRNDRRRPGLL